MMTDPDVQRELKQNRRRGRLIGEIEDEDNRPPDDPVNLIDDAYEAFVEPPLLNDEPDPQDIQRRRIQNDEAERSS